MTAKLQARMSAESATKSRKTSLPRRARLALILAAAAACLQAPFLPQAQAQTPSQPPSEAQSQSPSQAPPQSEAVVLGRAEAQQHVLRKVDPVYPEIARAANISGAVVLHATVAEDGSVAGVKVVSGPPMLRQAAIDAVSQWTYRPFEINGTPASAVAEVVLYFSLDHADSPDNVATADQYFPLADQCHAAMSAGGDVAALVDVCGRMAAAAQKFEPGTRFIERRSAYVFDAAALLRAHQYPQAEAMARLAIAVIKEGHDDNAGSSSAYAVLGNALGLQGKLEAADVNLTTAENFQRAAIAGVAGQAMEQKYKDALKTILLFHADVLRRQGRADAAQKKLDEAAALNISSAN